MEGNAFRHFPPWSKSASIQRVGILKEYFARSFYSACHLTKESNSSIFELIL